MFLNEHRHVLIKETFDLKIYSYIYIYVQQQELCNSDIQPSKHSPAPTSSASKLPHHTVPCHFNSLIFMFWIV